MNCEPFKFSECAKEMPKQGLFVDIWQKLKDGKPISRQDKNLMFHQLQTQTYSKTAYTVHGWKFPLEQWLKKFYVEYEYGDIRKLYAFDKTCIRDSFYTKNGIAKITEVKG